METAFTRINTEYREWLIGLASDWCKPFGSYLQLFTQLFYTPYSSDIDMDTNRISDGLDLRLRFTEENTKWDYKSAYLYLVSPCNMLEIMVALVMRCQQYIIGDLYSCDRSGDWMYSMLSSSKMADQVDSNFNTEAVKVIANNIIAHNYKKNGEGGLFTISDKTKDMRTAELWYQLMWYLDEVL